MAKMSAFVESITYTDPTSGPLTARVELELAPYEGTCPDCGQEFPTFDASDPLWKTIITNLLDGQHITLEVLP